MGPKRRRTPLCVDFLSDERRRLLRKVDHPSYKENASVYAALASVEDWLGNYASALDNISTAVRLQPSNSEYIWLKEKMCRQAQVSHLQEEKSHLLKTAPQVFPSFLEVERISAKEVDPQAFLAQYVQMRKPVIVVDAVSSITDSVWSMEFIKSIAGSNQVTVKRAVPQSVEWAKLEESRTTTVGEFISDVQGGKTKEYLFDWSLPLHCPKLADCIKQPEYFSGNFLLQSSPGSLYRYSWPSLFVAPKGVVSNLHVDAFASNFWMVLFQGQKRWTFFDTGETPLLYPQYIHSMDPVFSVDLAKPDLHTFPLLALTTPRQCVLQPGELLFVPGGSPHYVENLTDSVAVSSNHVDHSNYKQVCEELRVNALVDPRAGDLLQQLESSEFMQRVKGQGCGEHG